MNKIILIPVFIVALLSFCNCTNSSQIQNNGVINLGQQEYAKVVKEQNAIVIDVRTPAEVSQGYIKGTNIFADINGKEFESQISKLDPQAVYIVYCRSGSRSSSAANYMVENGFSKVYNLEGGILSWKGEVVKP